MMQSYTTLYFIILY